MPDKPRPKFVPFPDSYKAAPPNAALVGPSDPATLAEVNISVRSREERPPFVPGTTELLLTREARAAYEKQFGGNAADLKKVAAFYQGFGLKATADADRREVQVRGTVGQLAAAFQVIFQDYQSPGGQPFRGRTGPYFVPEDLLPLIEGAFGLDDRPIATPKFRVGGRPASGVAAIGNGALAAAVAPFAGFTGQDLAKYYNFPPGYTGKGQTIGLLELSGGYADAEVATYFKTIGVERDPANLIAVGPHVPLKDPNSDGEVLLDIEVAGAIAPEARLVVYFAAANTGKEFLQLIHNAVHDPKYSPSVISISWGGPEAGSASGQFYTRFHSTLDTARRFGITVCAASGDDGSADYPLNDPRNPWDGNSHVDYPASDPYTLGCGGTSLRSSGSSQSEQVWGPHPGEAFKNEGSGGGVSRLFDLPDYQTNAGVPPANNPPDKVRRGVPDVAAMADPATGYRVLVNGQWFPDPAQGTGPYGGTSAAAPLWAGLIALLNEALARPLGYLHPALYALSTGEGMRDITVGNSGTYVAGLGWDPCTGLGVPDGAKLLAALKNPSPATPATAQPRATADTSSVSATLPLTAPRGSGEMPDLVRDYLRTTREIFALLNKYPRAEGPRGPAAGALAPPLFARAAGGDTRARLRSILESYGNVYPVANDTIISRAYNGLGTFKDDVNAEFHKNYSEGDFNPGDTVNATADFIDLH